MTAEYRARLVQGLYLVGPLVTLIGVVAVFESGLANFILGHLPTGIGRYVYQAREFAPFGWFTLTLGCALGFSLNLDRACEEGGWELIAYLASETLIVFAVQGAVCGVAFGSYMLVAYPFR